MQWLASSVARGQDHKQANKQAVSRLDVGYENKPSRESKTLCEIVTRWMARVSEGRQQAGWVGGWAMDGIMSRLGVWGGNREGEWMDEMDG